jgi:hypothetical protein
MISKLNEIREENKTTTSSKRKLIYLLIILSTGIIFGFLAKYADTVPDNIIPGLSDIGTYLGLWILVVTILAVLSPSPSVATVRVLTFLLAMISTYYIYSLMLFGFFSKSYFLIWSFIALCSPIFSIMVWYSRGKGWIAAFNAAFPIGMLLIEGFSFVYVLPLHIIQFVFDLIAAILLLVILPTNQSQRIRILSLSFVIFILIRLIRLPI